MEMRCTIEIYEFEMEEGHFSHKSEILHRDVNTSAKELFEEVMDGVDITNRFFIMLVNSRVDNDESKFDDSINFYTVRTNERGTVEKITVIGPNNIDKDMLVDAIIGCKPTEKFVDSLNDRIISNLVTKSESSSEYNWTDDAKERLNKFNLFRLKEIYKKIKS